MFHSVYYPKHLDLKKPSSGLLGLKSVNEFPPN